jgi:hypothetical protein
LTALSLKRDAGIIYRRPGEISTKARAVIAELRRIAAHFGHV